MYPLGHKSGPKAGGQPAPQYNLGGGATGNGGIANSYSISAIDDASATIADAMEF
jgi:hypothetical protein